MVMGNGFSYTPQTYQTSVDPMTEIYGGFDVPSFAGTDLTGTMAAATPFDYMLSPLEQFRRAQASRFGVGDYGAMNPLARQAAERQFEPLYGVYQAAEPSGAYATFSDFLRERPAVSPGQITQAAQAAGGYTAAADPLQYALYYGGEGVSGQAALDRQRRLAQTQLLSSLGSNAMMNRNLAAAGRGVINRMYQDYVAGVPGAGGAGSNQFATAGPTGFMNYYLQQRGLAPTTTTA